MSKLQPSRFVAFNECIQNHDREKDDWMELICLKLKEKGDEKQREHANFTKAQSVSLSLQLPSRILYVYRRTDCVAGQAVCVRQRWSLYQVYQRFAIAGMIRCIYITFIIKLSCSPFLSTPCRMRGTTYHPMDAGTNFALVVSSRDNNNAHGSSKNEHTI
jgi:hypothetical protein